MTESSANGKLLYTDEVLCRYGIGRVVMSVLNGSIPRISGDLSVGCITDLDMHLNLAFFTEIHQFTV